MYHEFQSKTDIKNNNNSFIYVAESGKDKTVLDIKYSCTFEVI